MKNATHSSGAMIARLAIMRVRDEAASGSLNLTKQVKTNAPPNTPIKADKARSSFVPSLRWLCPLRSARAKAAGPLSPPHMNAGVASDRTLDCRLAYSSVVDINDLHFTGAASRRFAILANI